MHIRRERRAMTDPQVARFLAAAYADDRAVENRYAAAIKFRTASNGAEWDACVRDVARVRKN